MSLCMLVRKEQKHDSGKSEEWWEYKELPAKPKEFFVLNNLLADVGWETLMEIKDKEQEHDS